MTKNKEIDTIVKEASPMLKNASSVAITDAKSMNAASALYTTLKGLYKRLTDDKKKITDPMKVALKEINSRYEGPEAELKGSIDLINDKMTRYQTLESARVKEEEDAIAARIKEGKGNLSLETAERRMEAIERPSDKIVSDAGKLSFRPVPTLKVTSLKDIPREYFDLNESRLLNDLKAGKEVKGAEIFIEQRPVARVTR